MANYNVTSPDGQKYKVTAPDNASHDDVIKYVQEQHKPKDETFGEPKLDSAQRGAAERMLGAGELVNNLGIGKHIGLPPNDILEGAVNIAKEQGRGQGVTGALGEIAGDPLSWAGGAEYKAAEGAVDLAKVGAKYGTISGATQHGAKDLSENLKNAGKEGTIGAAAGAAGKVIPEALKQTGKAVKMYGEGFGARTPEELVEAAAAIRKESDGHYKTMRDAEAVLKPETIAGVTKSVDDELAKTGLMNQNLHGDTMSVLADLKKASAEGMSLEALDQHRRLLSGVINKNIRSNPEEVKKAATAISAIDDAVGKLTANDLSKGDDKAIKALNNARSTWAKARKFEMISDIVEKAGGDPNRRKVLLEQLANNAKKTRGFTESERQALKEAAQNNTAEGLVKMAGKFGINIGSGRAAATGNVIPAIELLSQGVQKGGKVVLGGTIAKHVQNKIGQAKTERLLKEIEGKSAAEAIGAEENPLMRKP